MTKTFAEFLSWVDSFLNFEKLPEKNIFWLDTMEFLCSSLNNPQDLIPSYHVAGSKGKGSVSAMISSILTEAGKKTGIYASPHIEDFRERIRLDDSFFPDEIYDKAASELYEKFNLIKDKIPNERSVTWFELVTVFAFLCMKHAEVDEAVYEVGLGGRLDATNVIKPQISVINTIELEHTEFLGDTLEKIAAEKAGIIKKGVPVLCAAQVPEVKKVFKTFAEKNDSKIIFADEICKSTECNYLSENGKKFMQVKIKSNLFLRPLLFKTKMFGSVQAENALLASSAVKLIHPEITEDIIEKGLSKTYLPARFEIIKNPIDCERPNFKNSEIVIDGAHTVKSIKLTLDTFEKFYPAQKAHLLFACAADKDVEHIARLFSDRFEKVTLTKPGNTKTCNPQKMKDAFSKAKVNFNFTDDFKTGIKSAIEDAKKNNAVLLVTGSFYLASEFKKIIKTFR
ncbi:MAG: bifunctional folylpolyglutamate synthase/dihydrofolate synthase [Treponema sp.]